ncbi:flagellar assembly factor FliW [Gracilibacillus ureilyticus]|uniref:Flagellar assembly factor FliW n=1 Tax=Gracilibacillus ureilyticus TaxID=531814 RepID=A0A1H9NXW4_9BACI|nr:flagellar assembly protein FliW [Gracilibacillus ureilyticus]SER40768.1 flagellar assembly factor FliW [Gracilibacillus ureilyticus]
MRIETKYFGEVEVNESEIIIFPQGIPGFQGENKFILQSFEEGGLFQILQSTNNIDPAFVVVDPFLFVNDYQFKLDEATIEQLQIKLKEDVRVLAIVTVKEPLTSSTANLQAPVVINTQNNHAKQLISIKSNYLTREAIFQQTSTIEEE